MLRVAIIVFAAGLAGAFPLLPQPLAPRLQTNLVALGENGVVYAAHVEASTNPAGPWRIESTMEFADRATNGNRYLRVRLEPVYVSLITTNYGTNLPVFANPPPKPKKRYL